MHSLMIGSENAVDFHDWPETWQQSSEAQSGGQSLILLSSPLRQLF